MRCRRLSLALLPLVGACEITVEGGPVMSGLTWSVGGLLSIAAMLLYAKYRREGEPSGFKRFVTFMTGFPVTFFIMLTVQEDPERVLRRIDQDDDTYDLARLERDLAAFRARRLRIESDVPPAEPAPTVPRGLAFDARRQEAEDPRDS